MKTAHDESSVNGIKCTRQRVMHNVHVMIVVDYWSEPEWGKMAQMLCAVLIPL